MRRWLSPYLFISLYLVIFTLPTLAILSDTENPPQSVPDDTDYAAGIAAFETADWEKVIEYMRKVIARRPWHDNAYSLIGFAYRQLGDYRQSLVYYQQALELNPYHRGALEYLGETYLTMGCLA